jgi:hypothetical protein
MLNSNCKYVEKKLNLNYVNVFQLKYFINFVNLKNIYSDLNNFIYNQINLIR